MKYFLLIVLLLLGCNESNPTAANNECWVSYDPKEFYLCVHGAPENPELGCIACPDGGLKEPE